MKPKALVEIAADMWVAAEQRGTARTVLPRGLTIVVKVEGRKRFLGLHRGRAGVGIEECMICASAFKVPRHVRGTWLDTGAAEWSIYSWEAPEAEQLSLLEG